MLALIAPGMAAKSPKWGHKKTAYSDELAVLKFATLRLCEIISRKVAKSQISILAKKA